jgi:hypothetical protein
LLFRFLIGFSQGRGDDDVLVFGWVALFGLLFCAGPVFACGQFGSLLRFSELVCG